jgi:hypothetical protein
MINWETLTIALTSASQFERIFMLTSFNILIVFITKCIISSGVEVLDREWYEKTKEEEQTGKKSKERIKRIRNTTITICLILMVIVSVTLIQGFKDEYYDIKVAVTPKNITAQDLEKIKLKENKFLDLFQQSTPVAKAIYYPTTTKLIKEDNQLYFTTRILKDSYKNYKRPEEFKQDIEKILNKTIEDTEEQLATRPELMAKFTEEHLIKGK